MKLIPKRKLMPKETDEGLTEIYNQLLQTVQYITNITQGGGGAGFTGTLDDIPDGILYERMLATYLTSGGLIPDVTTSVDIGGATKLFAKGYIDKVYTPTRLRIPVGANMYD